MTARIGQRRYGPILSALVIAGLLWWFLRGLSLEGLAAEIRRARPSYVAGAALLSLFGFLFRIVRWRYLLAPLMQVPMRSAAAAVFVGWAVSAILPGRVGEVARAVLLRQREGLRASAALGTIVLERMLDALAILILVAASIGFLPAGTALDSGDASLLSAIRTGAQVVFGGLVGVTALILLMHHVPPVVAATLRGWAGRLPGVLGTAAWGMIEAFGSGLSGAVRSGSLGPGISPMRLRLGVAVHSAALWTVICAVHVLLLRAFAIEASLYIVPPLLFLITLGLAVPVPGAVGSYHKAVQVGLTAMLGVSGETAAGYAVVSHAVTLGPPTVIGLIVLAREGLSLASLSSWRAAGRSPDR